MKILSMSKSENRSIYSVKKTQDFWKRARALLKKIGVREILADMFGTLDNTLEGQEKKIEKLSDERDGFEIDKNSEIDFIIGDKKVFIIFSYKKDFQQRFSKAMFSIFGGSAK